MNKKVWSRLMVVSSCGLVLSGLPVAQAEEVSDTLPTEEQAVTIEEPAAATEQSKEQVEAAPAATKTTTEVESSKEQSQRNEKAKVAVPSLKGVKNQTIKAGTSFDPKAGVTASDVIDGDLTKQIQVIGSVDSHQAGTYSLTYTVKNSFGETTSETVTILVEKAEQTDRTRVRRREYTLEIADFATWRGSDLNAQIIERLVLKDANGEVASLDDVDAFTIDQPKATDTVGKKTVKLSVTASDGTISEKTITVTVVNGLRIETKDFSNRGDMIDLFEGIQAFEMLADGSEVELGSYDPTTKTGIEVIKNMIDMKTPGEYELVYRVHSSLGEIVDKRVTVTVVKTLFPQLLDIEVSDQVMTVGDVLTSEMILDWVKVSEDCLVSFEVLDRTIPVDSAQRLTTAGTYRIRYTASLEGVPSNDVAVSKEITLTVRERPVYSNPTIQTRTLRTSPQLGSVNTAKQLPKTGDTSSNWLMLLTGISLVAFVAFLKRERLLSPLTKKK
ncbi:immunoglobulin-like domain-containing protein [Candidatus Enterococcus murrayae]|uniref:DUF5011 domain-containing protein n=1 Tax=Candidatus Enterococcus murrayae TaxID=2815321 RepID=A0ABS3HDU9_9ENTE|nr:immunoglobulin-like domain-containing protein [Enterococcus sp. MJM16]MBO0451172.1 DUF5011 domain-containing protein [Enterococcus sp. MJM16]